jgi:hypothetical protein
MKMMKKTLVLCITLFISFIIKAQEIKNLYLISGHPYDNTDEEFSSYLWLYSENSLDTISILSNKDDFLENVKVYPEQNLVVMHKANSIRRQHLGDNHRLLFVDYRDSIRFSEVSIDIDGKFEYFISLKDDVLLLDMYSKERGKYFKRVDIKNLNIEEVDIDNFIHAKITGIPGGMIDGKDYLLVYSNEQNGSLEISLVGDRDERPIFSYSLPEQYQFKSYERHVVSINNSEIFVLHGEYEKASTKLGSSEIIYLNKRNNRWNKVIISGNIQKPRGFYEWIVGFVTNDHIKGKKLPGAGKWTYRESGLSPKERWNYYPEFGEDRYVYTPGILYFYNTLTEEYFEIETNQADSEVILLQANSVIYRVYDELYIAEIINGKKLDKPKLLIKDDRVPDIHWAFFMK